MSADPDLRLWRLDVLALCLPGEFQQTDFSRKREQVLDIPDFFSETLFARWTAPADRSLAVHCWNPHPPRAGHPIRMVERWTTQAAGHEIRFARTDIFEGDQREVLVAWFDGPEKRQYRVVGSELPREHFVAIVETATFTAAGE